MPTSVMRSPLTSRTISSMSPTGDAVADQRLAAQARLQEVRQQRRPLGLRSREVVELGELADRQVAAERELAEDVAAARGFRPSGEHLVERGGLLGRRDHQHRIARIEAVEVARPQQRPSCTTPTRLVCSSCSSRRTPRTEMRLPGPTV